MVMGMILYIVSLLEGDRHLGDKERVRVHSILLNPLVGDTRKKITPRSKYNTIKLLPIS